MRSSTPFPLDHIGTGIFLIAEFEQFFDLLGVESPKVDFVFFGLGSVSHGIGRNKLVLLASVFVKLIEDSEGNGGLARQALG